MVVPTKAIIQNSLLVLHNSIKATISTKRIVNTSTIQMRQPTIVITQEILLEVHTMLQRLRRVNGKVEDISHRQPLRLQRQLPLRVLLLNFNSLQTV